MHTHQAITAKSKEYGSIDNEAWERGVRDGFAGGRHPAANEYSYSSGWIEGEAARLGYDVSVQIAEICGLLPCEARRRQTA